MYDINSFVAGRRFDPHVNVCDKPNDYYRTITLLMAQPLQSQSERLVCYVYLPSNLKTQ